MPVSPAASSVAKSYDHDPSRLYRIRIIGTEATHALHLPDPLMGMAWMGNSPVPCKPISCCNARPRPKLNSYFLSFFITFLIMVVLRIYFDDHYSVYKGRQGYGPPVTLSILVR